ncbi:MAG: membrane protein insertion efficiency factor YidD [Gammaproteobacteria bacterium TMED1]|nr:MAG: membrane protein insertion efficiency factor YidD [Gammaproteobacteria bacterium TMED1]
MERNLKKLLLISIRIYQLTLSSLIGGQCRFYPSCSNYALEAINRHGLMRGSCLSVSRLCKCHPLHPGGVDLVPELKNNATLLEK